MRYKSFGVFVVMFPGTTDDKFYSPLSKLKSSFLPYVF